MTSIYKNKKEALKGLKIEMEACRRFAKSSEERAKERKIGFAIRLLDNAQMAKECADEAHEALWELLGGNLTDEEYEIFCDAETLIMDINKAYEAIQRARN